MSKIRISPELALPEDVVTSTVVVYGGKGMGKTNLGSVLVEELTKAQLRWCVLDPMGVWWGLRHSADGKGPGVQCVILGGAHGDIPIEPTGGAVVADLVIDEGVNTIVDFSRKPDGRMWSAAERIRFVTDYTKRLFERQGELVGGRRREPLMQVLDEAARYIPQTIPSGAIDIAKCVGAWEQVCEEGRNIGLGVTFLTQRSARMNKSVSELADVMFAFRTFGPNSLDAIMDWLGEHVDKARAKELSAKVRELNVGQALVVSPGWLRTEKLAQIRMRDTFDSSATPRPGERAKRVTGAAAKPDLTKYRERMAGSIEEAKANDPKVLRARVRQLEEELAAERGKAPPTERVDVLLFSDEDRRALETLRQLVDLTHQNSERALRETAKCVTERLAALEAAVRERAPATTSAPVMVLRGMRIRVSKETAGEILATSVPGYRTNGAASDGLGRCERALLSVMAQRESSTYSQLAILSGYSLKSSGFANAISKLRTGGFAVGTSEAMRITPEGRTAVGRVEPLPKGDALVEHWMSKLGLCERTLLRVLVDARRAVPREDLAERSGYSITSSGFANALSTLRTLELIEGRNELSASPSLMSSKS